MPAVESAMIESAMFLAQSLFAREGGMHRLSSRIRKEILAQGERAARQASELRDLGGMASLLTSAAGFLRGIRLG